MCIIFKLLPILVKSKDDASLYGDFSSWGRGLKEKNKPDRRKGVIIKEER
jgi:hypothetical protein